MAGLAYHRFVSAATGMVRRSAHLLGSFWVDLTCATLSVLLPVCLVGALVLVSQGVIQNFNPSAVVHTLEGGAQVITQGPVASLEIITASCLRPGIACAFWPRSVPGGGHSR
jgi:K+-transporting ATPase ATPase A chain